MPARLSTKLFRTTPSLAPIPHRGVLSVSGFQALEFLNGLLSTSVPKNKPFYSAFLHAQGRILYDVFLYTTKTSTGEEAYLIEYDSQQTKAPPLLSYLKRHVLRSKVRIRDVADEFKVWSAWGSPEDHILETQRQWKWSPSGVIEPCWSTDAPWGDEHEIITDRRAPGMGRRLIVRSGERPLEASNHDLVTSDEYLLHRIIHGVPEGTVDIPGMQAFPIEANLDIMGGLDFRKGCYVGQELTVRTYHRGDVRKRIIPVIVNSPDQKHTEGLIPPNPILPPGTDIRYNFTQSSNEDGRIPRPRTTGKLFSSYLGVGLALLRTDYAAFAAAGQLQLQIETSEGNNSKTWEVSPWWPQWWPHTPKQDSIAI